jgi:uncharacterized protein (UPF0333 family)
VLFSTNARGYAEVSLAFVLLLAVTLVVAGGVSLALYLPVRGQADVLRVAAGAVALAAVSHHGRIARTRVSVAFPVATVLAVLVGTARSRAHA